MSATITCEQIVASLSKHLADNLTSGVTVQYPGETLDYESLTEWAEVHVPTLRRLGQRKISTDQWEGVVNVFCFVKQGTDQYRIWDIVNDVNGRLDHAEITLTDFNSSGEPCVGHLRTYEMDMDDFTREMGSSRPPGLRGIQLTFRAYAQEG